MIQIESLLGNNFIYKIFLMPTVLALMFVAKYMIQYYQLDKNKWLAYLLYSSNFAFFIIVLKCLYNGIDQGSGYGYLISDLSLVFIAISVVYLVSPNYKYIEYDIVPQFVIFYCLYVFVYGFNLQASFLILLGFVLFWTAIYLFVHYKEQMGKNYLSYLFLSILITVSHLLVTAAQFHIPRIYILGVFLKTFVVLILAKAALRFVSMIALMYSDLKKDVYVDALTNTSNRKKFEETFDKYLSDERLSKFSIVLFDIDCFKQVNDSYGHLAGDYLLKEISKKIQETLIKEHSNGQLFRYGGDEFFLLFKNQNGDDVRNLMEQITRQITEEKYLYHDIVLNATISVGVAEIVEEKNPKVIIDKVDQNLYVAKSQGKNQVYYM